MDGEELRDLPETFDHNLISSINSINLSKLGQVLETQPTQYHRFYEDNESVVSETENRNVTQPVEAPHYF